MAASIPGVEIFSWKVGVCSVFQNTELEFQGCSWIWVNQVCIIIQILLWNTMKFHNRCYANWNTIVFSNKFQFSSVETIFVTTKAKNLRHAQTCLAGAELLEKFRQKILEWFFGNIISPIFSKEISKVTSSADLVLF